MDTSPKYIEMCRKAKEIQAQMPFNSYEAVLPNLYAYYNCEPYYEGEVRGREVGWFNKLKDVYCAVWLPRIDQFIEILGDESTFNDWFRRYIIFRFSEMSPLPQWSSDDGRNIKFDSMEQLLLAYVMWEKHEKRWDGIDWIAK